jgi:hypothetical protein
MAVFFHGPILLNFSLFEEGQIQPFWTAPITPFVLWNLAKRALSGAFAKFIELQRGSDPITMLKGLAKKLFRIDWRDRRV